MEVSAAGISPVEFILYSDGYRDAGDYIPPGLYMRYLNIVNDKGEPVNASKAGTELKAPLTAELFRLYDEYEMEKYTCIKDGSPTDCWRINASGIVNVEPVTDGTITYTPTEGGGEIISTENLNNGKYEAAFKTGSEPAVNRIEAEGEASITVPEVFYDPFTNKAVTEDYPEDTLAQKTVPLKSGQEVLFDRDTKQPILTGSQKEIYTVYGVDVLIDTPLSAVLIDNIDVLGYGYSINDLNVSYTIEPDGYSATTAYVDLIEEDIPVNRIPSEPAGTGSATYAEGYQFNLDKKYEVQVILNPGTGTEIQSDKEELMAAKMSVVNEDRDEIEELRYSNGTNDKKRYHIELEIGRLFGTISCEDITAEISTRQQDGNYATVPGVEYPGEIIPLTFKESGIIFKKCISQNLYTDTGTTRSSFILTNLSKEAIGDAINETAPLYGGIGNKFRIKLSGALEGAMVDMPIEPVGVIVIGIDGLRQDVLYPDKMDGNDFENVNEGNYYIDASTLDGLGQILIGNPTDSTTQQYIMLPEVTSIFPSITFASWASIFTGKLPNETGILGNEFFARDRYNSNGRNTVPGMSEAGIPSGMVTLSSGAFSPGTGYWGKKKDLDFALGYVTPVEFWPYSRDTLSKKRDASAPGDVLQTVPLWWDVNNLVRMSYQINSDDDIRCDESEYECRTVSMFNQYTDPVDWWGTPSASWSNAIDVAISFLEAAKVMDKAATNDSIDFINNYFSRNNPDGKRKRFPAVFSIYYSALDHYAHTKGMEGYQSFFQDTTDPEIKEVVDVLKQQDEFDNKIFIITADHGHTAMPTDSTYIHEEPLYDPESGTFLAIQQTSREAEMSCELKTNFAVNPENVYEGKNARNAERANNNLHIWELGEVLKLMPTGEVTPEGKKLYYKVLAPIEIVKANKGETTTTDLNQASIIAAFNGPMAHIYVKGENGWDDNPQSEFLTKVTDLLSASLAEGDGPIPRIGSSIDAILIRPSRDSEYVVYNGATYNAEGKITLNDPIPINSYFSDNLKYIDALNRINGMNNPDRSGDIILVMKSGTDSSVTDRYSTGVSCKSWHGSLNRSDSYVPLIIAYPGGNRYELDLITQKVCANNLCEGNWKFKDLITEIIETQYSGQ